MCIVIVIHTGMQACIWLIHKAACSAATGFIVTTMICKKYVNADNTARGRTAFDIPLQDVRAGEGSLLLPSGIFVAVHVHFSRWQLLWLLLLLASRWSWLHFRLQIIDI